jgi:hypothetical protein
MGATIQTQEEAPKLKPSQMGKQKAVFWEGSGASIGSNDVMSPKCTEMCGIVSALFLSLWICKVHVVLYGSLYMIMSDCKPALHTFSKILTGTPPSHHSNNIDLLLEGKEILQQPPLRDTFEWIPGHSNTHGYLPQVYNYLYHMK